MPIEFILKDTLWDMKLSQRKASELTGILENTMSNLCRGDVVRVPLDQVNKLCRGLNIPIEKILPYTPE